MEKHYLMSGTSLVITCPYCKKRFYLTKALMTQIQNAIKSEIEDEKNRKIEEEIIKVRNEIKEKYKKIVEEIRQETEIEFKMKLRERDEIIKSLNKQIESLRQKIQQGSQWLHGEVQQLELKDILEKMFPTDKFVPIGIGEVGPDLLQYVKLDENIICGIILWESKRTQNWSNKWVSKIKEDKYRMKANVAILVSKVLPEKVQRFCNIEGIWVTDFQSLVPLATILREYLMQIKKIQIAVKYKETKMESLYRYITSDEFNQRISQLVESYIGMEEELKNEKLAINRLWIEREQLLNKLKNALSGIYGELKGILHSSLYNVEKLELQPKAK